MWNIGLSCFWGGHETLMSCWGMLFFKPALSSSKRWEKLWCQISGRKGVYGNKEGKGQCCMHHEDRVSWVSPAPEQHINLYSLFLLWNSVLRCLIFWLERRVDVRVDVCLVFWVLAIWNVLSSQKNHTINSFNYELLCLYWIAFAGYISVMEQVKALCLNRYKMWFCLLLILLLNKHFQILLLVFCFPDNLTLTPVMMSKLTPVL